MSARGGQGWDELARRIARRTGLAGLTLDTENVRRAAQRAYVDAPPDALFDPESEVGFGAWDALIDELTVRETYFFRHNDQFELLRRRVLPELREHLREHGALRVWSAGCASGEEAYSLAMLFEQEGLLEHVSVLATDISRAAIERGREARYREWSFRALGPALQEQHFRSEGAQRVVLDPLRNRVTFRQLNLAEPSYPSVTNDTCAFSLIFCRNVLMFLDVATIAAIAGRLHAALLRGGWLFTGPSDPNLGQYAPFEVHVSPAGLVYRRPAHDGALLQSTLLPAAAGPVTLHAPAAQPLERPHSSDPPRDPKHSCAEIRATWNALGAEPALARCTKALAHGAAHAELHHLEALLLWELRRFVPAANAMRRVLYLDRSNAVAHFGLAALLERTGDLRAARRSYANALACCDKVPPDYPLPLGDGIVASGLRGEVLRSLRRLDALEAARS